MSDLIFLHTAPANELLFSDLMSELAPGRAALHVTEPGLLDEALSAGRVTPAIEARLLRLAGTLGAPNEQGRPTVICTCSTLGEAAEQAGRAAGVRLVRIDRAMAEEAVRLGDRILVAACVPTTLAPTEDLLREVAGLAGREVEIRALLVEDAWAHFQRGDRVAYWRRIAEALEGAVGTADVVVLAQASMAGAVDFLAGLGRPVLSSPRLGLEACLAGALPV
ncbi:MAG: arylsulfatase [Alphaproteobacteria bacterium]|nr:arylsulfatase [Alphaproteobacteria bacterium]